MPRTGHGASTRRRPTRTTRPGYLYALWAVGVVGEWLGGVGDLIKIPAILTDIAMGYLVWSMAMELGVTRKRAVLAAAIVIFNPVTWFDSVIWGQVDSFGTVFLLLSIRELWRGRSERSAVFAVMAAITKPQLAILIPIVALVVIRRSLWPKGAWGDEIAPRIRGFAWERNLTGWIRILTTGVAGFVTAVLLALPFGLTVLVPMAQPPFVDSSLLRLITSTAGVYPYLTVNAYNIWALFPVDGSSMATGGGWLFDSAAPDAAAWGQIGPFPAAAIGAILLLAVAALVAVAVARRPDRLTILVGTCVIAFAFFAVPTRVHERYLFPLFGLAGILIAFSWRWRMAYLAASIATFLNMYVVLTTLYGDMNPGVSDWLGIGEWIRSPFGVTVVALLHTAAFLWALAQLRPKARRTLATELATGRVEEAVLEADYAESHVPVPHALPEGAVVTRTELSGAGATAAGATATGAARRGCHRRRCHRPRGPPPRPWRRRGRHPRPARRRPSSRRGTTGHPGRSSARSRGSGPGSTRRPSARIDPATSTTSGTAASTGSTCSSWSCSSWPRSSCGATGWPSPPGCTSTRSTTPGPRPSSSRRGATTSPTTSTSGRTRISRSTSWRAASSPSPGRTSRPRRNWASPSATPRPSPGVRIQPPAARAPGTGCGSPPGPSSSPTTWSPGRSSGSSSCPARRPSRSMRARSSSSWAPMRAPS